MTDDYQAEVKLEDIACMKCEKHDIKLVGRATWICQNCQKDNSLYVVLMSEASERERSITRKEKG